MAAPVEDAGEKRAPFGRSVTTLRFKHVFTTQNPGRIDDYYIMDMKKMLGEGSYGKVTVGTSKTTGQLRAVKAIDTTRISDAKRFEDEVAIQMELHHPHIVKLYEVFKDAKRIYLVMELCDGGELFDRIVEEAEKHGDTGQAFDEVGAATYMQQILGAMQYLHGKEFVHRDIKPENFLLQSRAADAPIKVIDFGLAKKFAVGEPMRTKAGTPYYVAPEVLAGSYRETCDIWSCGVICYILLCGYPPFHGDRDEDVLRRVRAGKFQFPKMDWENISKNATDIITLMLTFDQNRRPSCSTLLEHPWFRCITARPADMVPLDMGNRLRQFRTSSKLKRVALTLIAQQLRDGDIIELKSTFTMLDKNMDGTLSPQEIRDGMRQHGIAIPDDLAELMKNLDTDGSGCIDYTEFIAATMTTKQYAQNEVMWAAFRTFDIDGDGQITMKELSKILQDSSLEMAEKMIKEVDLDGDGTISFDEFRHMMRGDDGADIAAAAEGARAARGGASAAAK